MLASALVGALAAAPAAEGFVYWANAGSGTTIGRANLDGSGANESFITGTARPCGVAVDGQHIYWANDTGNSIGRANLDGSGVNQFFITGAQFPCGVAVDGGHVYWANGVSSGSIGRANLDGSSPNQDFITGANNPCGVAVDGGHVYWANAGSTTIGRANLNGSSPDQSFITGAATPCGVAVDGAHVYWANDIANGTIGRANVNGTGVDQSFITGADGPCGVAVDGAHIYWANGGYNEPGTTIGRANLNGSGADQSFITGATTPCGVTADALPPPVVQTGAASSISQSSAVLNGSANPEGSSTSYRFEYGRTTAYGSRVPVPDAAVGSDSSPHAVAQAISGLQPGTTYHFRLVATNAAGSSNGADHTFTTAPSPTTALKLTNLGQSHRRWREGRGLAHISSVGRPPLGTTFRFTLNESAKVRFAFKQRLPGRLVGGRCLAPTAKNVGKTKCTRLLTRGSLSFSLDKGARKLRFQGRLSKHKKLPLGHYTLVITATNAAGQRTTARLTFTIVAG